MTGPGVCRTSFAAARWRLGGAGPAVRVHLPKNQPKTAELAAKKTQPRAATRDENLNSGTVTGFGDNNLNGIVAAGQMLSGCMQATTFDATNQTVFKPRDKELLAKVSYVKTPVAEPFRRAIVDYHRKEAPGSIVVDSDNHYLYLVQDGGKAIRYGITVGEEAMAWSGIAKVGSMTEWPPWHPTKSEISRLGVPTFVAPGPDNPMGSRARCIYSC